jgi:hypothetical protein
MYAPTATLDHMVEETRDERSSGEVQPDDASSEHLRIDPDAPPAPRNAQAPVARDQPDKDQGDALEQ